MPTHPKTNIPVEEHVDHDVPWVGCTDDAAHLQHHLCQQVVQAANRLLALVVCRDGNVHKLEWGIGIAKGNGGHVDIGRLTNCLMVNTGVGQHQQTGLLECLLNLVGECACGKGGEYLEGMLLTISALLLRPTHSLHIVQPLHRCTTSITTTHATPHTPYTHNTNNTAAV